jgi:predicted metal-dependent hydrolase
MSDSAEEHFNKIFQHGVDLFNKKEFFDCHDAFEELWMEERGERRLFLQGLIQAAVGCHHLSNGNTSGAISQYTKSLDKLRQYPDDYMGLEMQTFRKEIERCFEGVCLMNAKGVTYEVADSFFPELQRIPS